MPTLIEQLKEKFFSGPIAKLTGAESLLSSVPNIDEVFDKIEANPFVTAKEKQEALNILNEAKSKALAADGKLGKAVAAGNPATIVNAFNEEIADLSSSYSKLKGIQVSAEQRVQEARLTGAEALEEAKAALDGVGTPSSDEEKPSDTDTHGFGAGKKKPSEKGEKKEKPSSDEKDGRAGAAPAGKFSSNPAVVRGCYDEYHQKLTEMEGGDKVDALPSNFTSTKQE